MGLVDNCKQPNNHLLSVYCRPLNLRLRMDQYGRKYEHVQPCAVTTLTCRFGFTDRHIIIALQWQLYTARSLENAELCVSARASRNLLCLSVKSSSLVYGGLGVVLLNPRAGRGHFYLTFGRFFSPDRNHVVVTA
jgi:hypothetical protein